MESQPRPSDPSQLPTPQDGGRPSRLGLVLQGAGIVCLAWAALHMADASLAGSGRTFESRQSYDAVKERSRSALIGTLARAAAGAVLLGLGARMRRTQPS